MKEESIKDGYRWVRLCSLASLSGSEAIVVPVPDFPMSEGAYPPTLSRGSEGSVERGPDRSRRMARWRTVRPSLLVFLKDGVPKAYLNVCPHLDVPLDGGVGRLKLAPSLTCLTHGARFRVDDGTCVRGPCLDDRLESVEVLVEGAFVFASVPFGG